MRIAMISEHGDPLAILGGQQSGGQNVYVYELARFLSKLGHKVDVFTRYDDPKKPQIEKFADHAKVIRIKAGPVRFLSKDKFGPIMPKFVREVEKYRDSKKIKYDLIHAHYYFSGWAGVQLKKIFNVPLVVTFHSLGLVKRKALGRQDESPKERTMIEKMVMEEAEKIIAVSPDEKKNMISEYGAEKSKILVIPPGVNLERFRPLQTEEARKRLGLENDLKIIVFAGKMEKRKGGITLIKAIKVIKQDFPKLYQKLRVFMFSGDPRKKRAKASKENKTHDILSEQIEKSQVGERISYLAGVNQDELRFYYGAANVVVMPSFYEPFGMVATESMATVTPVVASNVGGLKWSIVEGKTGYHAEPKDARDFAKKIVKVLKDDELCEILGRNAFLRVRNNFNWFWISRTFVGLYESLIKQKNIEQKIVKKKIIQVLNSKEAMTGQKYKKVIAI